MQTVLLLFVLCRVLWKTMDCRTKTGVVQKVMVAFDSSMAKTSLASLALIKATGYGICFYTFIF